MNLSELKNRTRPVRVEFAGEYLTAEYRPWRLTGELVDDVTAAKDDPRQSAVVAKACAAVLAAWDLTDDGQPYPITVESLLELPLSLLSEIFAAIVRDASPNPTSRNNSGSF